MRSIDGHIRGSNIHRDERGGGTISRLAVFHAWASFRGVYMSKRMLPIISKALPKMKRSLASSLGSLLVLGGVLIVSQGCVASTEAPMDEVAPTSADLVAASADEYPELLRAANSVSLPPLSEIQRMPTASLRNAAQNVYNALQNFRQAPRNYQALNAAAQQVLAAGSGLDHAISQYLGGGREGAAIELGPAGLTDEDIGSSILALSSRSRDYRDCLKNAQFGYTLCLSTATTDPLKVKCVETFGSISVACNIHAL
jgi:hypothetical protein